MIRIYLLMFVLLFSVNVFSESTTDNIESIVRETFDKSNGFKMGFSYENPLDSHHILDNPEFAFENFDMDILEKQEYEDTEPEEITDNNCIKEEESSDHFPRVAEFEYFNPEYLDYTDYTYEELLAMSTFSKQENTSEQCEQYTFQNTTYSNPNDIYDLENMRYFNMTDSALNRSHYVVLIFVPWDLVWEVQGI